MNIKKKVSRILEHPVCDHCLGRQFAQLGTGYTNEERGYTFRNAMEHNQKIDKVAKDLRQFRFKKSYKKFSIKHCSICNNFFTDKNMEKWLARINRASRGLEYKTFKIGTKLSDDLIEKEESLWERAGIDYCEPIKSEINREMGKLVEKDLHKTFSANPDIVFLLDIANRKVLTEIKPLMFYGEYQKLQRGIPQTKWPSGKYKTSVEQIIAKPYIAKTRSTGTKFHGCGREDIDARCLGWRPFVLELLNPCRRLSVSEIRLIAKKVPNNKVKIRKLRLSDNKEIAKLKEIRPNKTYTALVECKKDITKNDLKQLQGLVGEIQQQTPTRVLHRRSDLLRKRRILDIRTKMLTKKSFRITVCTEAGTYVKEFISGDNNRTKPSISEMLENQCECKKLDVVKIHRIHNIQEKK